MLNVSALTIGLKTPSSRFRVRQYIEPLRKMGCKVSELRMPIERYQTVPWIGSKVRARYMFPYYIGWETLKIICSIPNVYRANNGDIVWLQKGLMNGIVSLEPFLKKPFLFDVDDSVWLEKGRIGRFSTAKIAQMSKVVLVGNEYLADWFSAYTKKIEIIPTAVDTEKFAPAEDRHLKKGTFIIGWTGSGLNLSYLYAIEDPLFYLQKKYKAVEYQIISDRKPAFRKIPPNKVKFIKWQPSIEAEAMKEWDVGLMPLSDDELTRGKCSFKMLQYMSTGLPVVVSPVGMNCKLLCKGKIGFSAKSDKQWFKTLERLFLNREESRKMGSIGRRIVEDEFSLTVISKKIYAVMEKVSKSH